MTGSLTKRWFNLLPSQHDFKEDCKSILLEYLTATNIGNANMSDLFCKLWALAGSPYPVTPGKRHV